MEHIKRLLSYTRRALADYGVTSIDTSSFDYCDNLKDIYYGGTKEQWQKISIGESNEPLKKATVHFADESRVSVNPSTVKDGKIVYKNGKTEVMEDSLVRIASSRFIACRTSLSEGISK